jgi:Cof subfamily protein (haloacid dehalogenase superfamily)
MIKSGNIWLGAWPEMPAEKPDIRLVAIDLDDTMLTDELIITPRTKDAIRRARRQGVAVTIATGRMFESSLPYAKELALDDVPLITFQGALIIGLDGSVVSHRPMNREISLEMLDFLLSYNCHVTLYINDTLYLEETSSETERYRARIRVKFHVVPSLRAMLTSCHEEVTKYVFMAEEDIVKNVLADFEARFVGRAQAVPSKPNFLEISRPDTGKGVALEDIAIGLGLNRQQVMAIGDSPNDLDMLAYAGWGICMANGVDEAKSIARWITASNNEEGVAVAIEHLVLHQVNPSTA